MGNKSDVTIQRLFILDYTVANIKDSKITVYMGFSDIYEQIIYSRQQPF